MKFQFLKWLPFFCVIYSQTTLAIEPTKNKFSMSYDLAGFGIIPLPHLDNAQKLQEDSGVGRRFDFRHRVDTIGDKFFDHMTFGISQLRKISNYAQFAQIPIPMYESASSDENIYILTTGYSFTDKNRVGMESNISLGLGQGSMRFDSQTSGDSTAIVVNLVEVQRNTAWPIFENPANIPIYLILNVGIQRKIFPEFKLSGRTWNNPEMNTQWLRSTIGIGTGF
jgi:hypothetical protein